MKEDKFQEMTLCESCPILNTDYEQGCDCNLGYKTTMLWTPEGILVSASEDCGLHYIKHDGIISCRRTVMVREKRTDGYVPTEADKRMEAGLKKIYGSIMVEALEDLRKFLREGL